MQDPLYANAEAISSGKYYNPSLCPKNRLHLLPEHLAQISTAFIQQLSCSPLTSRELRILSVIYYQTIGYGKREDDMNGKCLELLTGIRGDHANEAIRRMESFHILITRQGSYGKWVSINFDFKNWGKEAPDTETNDPTVLLTDEYKTPLDKALDNKVFCLHAPLESLSTTKEVTTPNEITPPKETTPSDAVAIEPTVLIAPSAEPFSIHYPSALPKQLCDKMANFIKEISEQKQAQRLVDYFAIRLQSGLVRQPIAYFINLKNRLLKGQLDLSETSATHNKPNPLNTKTSKKVNNELPNLQAEDQLATADYRYVKNTIERVSNSNSLNFDEAAALINYTKIWQKAVKRVEIISKKLHDYQQQNTQKSAPALPTKKEEQSKRVTREIPQHISDILKGLEGSPCSLV